MSSPTSIDALVLAGRRGPTDPVAASAGVERRALVPILGVSMLERVVRTLRATAGIGAITVSIDDPSALDAVPALAALRDSGELRLHRSLASPSASVGDVVARLAPGTSLLATTADHPLLTPALITAFREAALVRSAADLVVGVVPARVVRAAFPGAPRTFVPLRGDGFSGANLFLLRAPGAGRVSDFWQRAERHRKRPWKLALRFGLRTLALFALRRLDLDAALARASRVIGARIEAVVLEDASAAVDVDRLDDLALATRLLAAREGGGRASTALVEAPDLSASRKG